MEVKHLVTAGLINYDGLRNFFNGKGRLQITLESLRQNCPSIYKIPFILGDNESKDGSDRIVKDAELGTKQVFPRKYEGDNWLSTTRNNMNNLSKMLEQVNTKYFWNIENDSYFFNDEGFLEKAVRFLELNNDISVIHLRRWVPTDAIDKPGAPQNYTRVDETREHEFGNLYVIQKTNQNAVWVPADDALNKDFTPENKDGGFKTLSLGDELGCVRKVNGKWERLLEDYFPTFANHGYIARTEDLKYIMEQYAPESEVEMAQNFKNHFKAAKMEEDAFFSFGWNTRVNFSPERLHDSIRTIEEFGYSSMMALNKKQKICG